MERSRAMVSKKYLRDYNIEKFVDEKGRNRSRAVYVGGDYVFVPAVPKANKLAIVLLSVVSDLAFIGAFFMRVRAARVWYVLLPFSITMISLYILTLSAFSLLIAKEITTRYNAERIAARLAPAAFVSGALAAVSAIGLAYLLVKSPDAFIPGDYVFGLMALVVAVATALAYARFRLVKAAKVGQLSIKDEIVF